jgi:disulfide bond formation protein DsbB
MAQLQRLVLRQWPLCAVLASALMLAIAHGFQQFGGLQPCTLCLRQREVYWAALAIGAIGVALQRAPGRPWLVRLVCIALAVVFAVGTGVAVYHAGAEWKWWPGPKACASAGGAVSADAIAAMLGGARIAPPSCDEAAWVFLGLSMAGWNALISLVLAVLSACAACCRPWLMRPSDPPGTAV